MGFTQHALLSGADLHRAKITQKVIQDFAQNGEVLVQHDDDLSGARIVQVMELVPGAAGLSNSSLDFDTADEAQFIQEDPTSGTDFSGGTATLHNNGAGFVPTTFDPAYLPIAGGLLEGDLRYQSNTTSHSTQVVKTPVSSGKWYFEVEVLGPVNGPDAEIGVIVTTGAPNSWLGSTTGEWCYDLRGVCWEEGVQVAPHPPAANIGDVVGVALDMDNLKLTFYLNGVQVGHVITLPAGPIYAAVGSTSNNSFDCRANFGQSPFIHPVPAGFQAGPGTVDNNFVPGPFHVTTSDSNHFLLAGVSRINSVTFTADAPVNTSLGVLVSFDGRLTWRTVSGGAIVAHPGLADKTGWAAVADMELALAGFVVNGEPSVDFAFLLSSTDPTVSPAVDLVTINYDEAGAYEPAPGNYRVQLVERNRTKITRLAAGSAASVKVNVLC